MFPRYDDILQAVPEYDGYPPVDEMEAVTDELLARSATATAWQCGVSRAGHPMRCIEIGDGPLAMLLLGLPHPEEPVGVLVIEQLLRLLTETDLGERLGYRFHIVKVSDPDGGRLNETWYPHPSDLAAYILNVYRPASADQFEWTFPFAYKRYAFTKPLPEAAAIRAVVDRTPLDCLMDLHNSSFSGSYFYISADDATLRDELAACRQAASLPAHRGEPEVPYLVTLGDGVFELFGLADEYDYLERYGKDPAASLTSGTAADEYANHAWDCFTMVAEVPHFTAATIADTSPAGVSRAEAKLRGLAAVDSHVDWLRARFPDVAAALTQESPWLRTVRAYLMEVKTDLAAERRQAETEPEFAAEATAAQVFDSLILRELDALTRVGQFARMAASEPQQTELLRGVAAEAEQRVRSRAAALQAASGLKAPPIRRLVQLQLAALLLSADHVRDRYRPRCPRPTVAHMAHAHA